MQPSGHLTFGAPVLRVADLPRSLACYTGPLGFSLEFEHEGFYAGVTRDGCRIHLKCAEPPRRDQAAFEAAEHIDVCFGVADAEAIAKEFAAAGATVSLALRVMPYGKELYVRDPDGYVLGFIQPL